MKRITLTLILFLVAITAFAHSDWIYTEKFGKVVTTIQTGIGGEARTKLNLSGEIINLLSGQLKNSTKLNIIVNHAYTTPKFKTKYCISYESDQIFIRVYCYDIVPLNLIKLAEYAMTNKKGLKSRQKEETFELPYKKETAISIGDSIIRKTLQQPNSDEVTKVMHNKIYRSRPKTSPSKISYYFQDNKYYITREEYNDSTHKKETVVVAELDNIVQIKEVESGHIMLFDSDSSFIFYASKYAPFRPKDKTSKRHVFNNLGAWLKPYHIAYMGRDMISITFYYNTRKLHYLYYEDMKSDPSERSNFLYRSTYHQKNMIYLADNDFLVEEASDIIDSVAMKRLGIPKTIHPYSPKP